VFCGLQGGRLQQTILADIIGRTAKRAGLEKHVTAHTLRHTAATWLRQELGDTRLVAEYLGHVDLSTVARYAHVDRDELHGAAGRPEQLAAPSEEPAPPDPSEEPGDPAAPPSRSDRPAIVAAVAGDGGGVEPPIVLATGDSLGAPDTRRPQNSSAIRIWRSNA
jgi:hypothetical protein